MLVLTRRREEKVILTVGGLVIEVQVTDIREDRVRLGFTAPPEVVIHREEVVEAIAREKQQ